MRIARQRAFESDGYITTHTYAVKPRRRIFRLVRSRRKVSNVVMLGACIEATRFLNIETIREMLSSLFTGPKMGLVDINVNALRRRAKYFR